MCKSSLTMILTCLSSFFKRFSISSVWLVSFFTTSNKHHPLVVLAALIRT